MQPNFDLRLKSMIASLSDVILPTIPESNKLAVEQANIIIGSLEMIRQQIDYAHWFEVACMLNLATQLTFISNKTKLKQSQSLELAERARCLATNYNIPLSAIREHSFLQRDLLDELIRRAFDESNDLELLSELQSFLLKINEYLISAERAFVAGTNFDVFPSTLMSIEGSLKKCIHGDDGEPMSST